MNTLSKATTVQIFPDDFTYHDIRKRWSELMRSAEKHNLWAAHHLLYLALMGKDWRKSFRFFTNQHKLDNGAFHVWGLFRATSALHMASREEELLAPFNGLVTPVMLQQIRQLIPAPNAYKLLPEQFMDGQFPFDAYSVPAEPWIG
ncbi:MAG: hypothetical protein HY862_18570 [Chloroflexi bacterium]|nr:hypothetical protein [Chloroflexota bacterium]